ncbi:MAG: magnesium chelatase subunit H, partial [Rhodobacteraceae bacterium]|nr:magnesium chelatase subunit H [Paracoccaceae bacterium]
MLDNIFEKSVLEHAEEASAPVARVPIRFVIVTLDSHLSGAIERVAPRLKAELPGLELSLHAAAEWAADPQALARAKEDVAAGDVVVANMLFMDDHLKAIMPALQARRDHCDAMIGCIAAAEAVKLTRIGRLSMAAPQRGPMALLKRLRGKPGGAKPGASSGAGQMAMLRRLPKILKYIPGKAQDLRAYFLTMQYWLSGSDENIANLIRFLIDRYADGPRRSLRGKLQVDAPLDHPDVGLYHPRLPERVTDDITRLPAPAASGTGGTVGLLLMRSYVLSGDSAHYDGVISALEAKGLRVVPAFAAGLDARPAIDSFFKQTGADGQTKTTVDAVVSLTGFSLVGGPAYNDAAAAEATLANLDVPYLAAHALEFQSLEAWRDGARGLTPIESTMMVAIPEIDGASGPMVFGGRSDRATGPGARNMRADLERAERLAARVAKLTQLRRTPISERRVAITLFNFPPNAGAAGTAAFLSVFESLHNTLKAMAAAGYDVEVPESVETLRGAILEGAGKTSAARYGAEGAVAALIPADDHVRREPHLAEIEKQWGPAPGRHQSDGRSIQVLGARLGNVFIGLQPGFGYEGDPMRLLFEGGFAPTHAFSAYYRWLREDFDAHAALHFGTHGALEFMPGKQTGLSHECWPDRLIGDLPNFYLYAGNNPSEGAIAKRRSAATLISYRTPPVAAAGLYKGLAELKASLERYRAAPPEAEDERARLAEMIAAQAETLDLTMPKGAPDAQIAALSDKLLELEYALIPHGLHVVGAIPPAQERAETLAAAAEAFTEENTTSPSAEALRKLAEGDSP